MSEENHKRERAMTLISQGLQAQEAGDLEAALLLYDKSIEVYPTAEGHTFLGWALSYDDDQLERAIEHCREAIALDPDFGNPYNDIGVYLMRRNEADQAIPWLEEAKRARRYEPRHFPYLNLGQIYAARGELNRAIEEFEGALRLAPTEERIHDLIGQLRTRLN